MKRVIKFFKYLNNIYFYIFIFILIIHFLFLFFFKTKIIKIEIISFNDFNGSIENKNLGASKFATAIKEWTTPYTFVVSSGDNYQGEIISNVLKTIPVDDLFSNINIIASAVGDKDFEYGIDSLKNSTTQYISTNIYYKKNNQKIFKPYIIKKYKGIKIAFIGLTTIQSEYLSNPEIISDIKFKDPVIYAERTIKKLPEKVDIIVLLAHIGAYYDEKSNIKFEDDRIKKLTEINGINLIVMGHSHNVVNGIKNNVLITENDENGQTISKVVFTIAKKGFIKTIIDKTIYVRNLYKENIEEDIKIKEKIASYKKQLNTILNEEIGVIDEDYVYDKYKNSFLSNYYTYILRKETNSQIAIISSDVIKSGLRRGKITVKDIYNTILNNNIAIKTTIKGSNLVQIFNKNINKIDKKNNIYYSGIEYDKNIFKLENGEKIKNDIYYTIVSDDYFIKKENNFDITNNIYESYGKIRDIILNHIKNSNKKEKKE